MKQILTLLLLIPQLAVAGEKLQVFVSVLPQKFFVEAIGGDRVDVDVLVLPGQSPATYNPSPQQMQRFSRADILFRVGVPFEDASLPRLLGSNSDLTVVDARQGIELLTLSHHVHDDDHGHEQIHEANERDPHIWTSPVIARKMAEQVRDALAALRPEAADYFHSNQQQLDAQLESLDRQIKQLLSPFAGQSFMVFHPSWGYFANTYDLQQIAIEYNGKQPNARRLSSQISQAREAGIKVIFVQPQFSIQTANAVADAIDGRLVFVDPLAEDYLNNLREVAHSLADYLKPAGHKTDHAHEHRH